MAKERDPRGSRKSGTGYARLLPSAHAPAPLEAPGPGARSKSHRPQRRRVGRVRQDRPAVPLPELLRELLTTPGPSGHEGDAAALWRRAAEGFAEVSVDALGSSVARVKGTADGPTLALVGHIDEIGLAVTHIDDKGFLFFRGLGGWLPEVLLAQRIEVLTRDGRIPGVIGKKSGPFKKEKDEKIDLKDLFIDIGARDGDDARSRVRIGDAAVVAGAPIELPNERVASR